jgi:hypothetical protein
MHRNFLGREEGDKSTIYLSSMYYMISFMLRILQLHWDVADNFPLLHTGKLELSLA